MRISLVFVLATLACALGVNGYFLLAKQSTKQGYVINQQLFDAFKGKQHLERELKRLKKRHQLILDSLAMVEAAKTFQSTSHYNQVQQQFVAEEEHMSATYTAAIWKDINQHLATYGEQQGFQFIHGASGDGSLMYADEVNNITEDVIQYINQKYDAD